MTEQVNFSLLDVSTVSFKQNKFDAVTVYQYDPTDFALALHFSSNTIGRLSLDFRTKHHNSILCNFEGGNEIDILAWHGSIDSEKHSIFFGQRELIGERLLKTKYVNAKFYNYASFNHMRNLLLELKQAARLKGDNSQENLIASFISLIEFVQIKNEKWYKNKQGWQNRLLFGWRNFSTKFYRSWIRPLVLLMLGYMLINIIPFLYIGFEGYGEFCFYRPHQDTLFYGWIRNCVRNRFCTIPESQYSLDEFIGSISAGLDHTV